MSLKTSPFVGGVHVTAFAPAAIVALMVSSVGPPVAIIGMSGYFLRIFSISSGVLAAADTRLNSSGNIVLL